MIPSVGEVGQPRKTLAEKWQSWTKLVWKLQPVDM